MSTRCIQIDTLDFLDATALHEMLTASDVSAVGQEVILDLVENRTQELQQYYDRIKERAQEETDLDEMAIGALAKRNAQTLKEIEAFPVPEQKSLSALIYDDKERRKILDSLTENMEGTSAFDDFIDNVPDKVKENPEFKKIINEVNNAKTPKQARKLYNRLRKLVDIQFQNDIALNKAILDALIKKNLSKALQKDNVLKAAVQIIEGLINITPTNVKNTAELNDIANDAVNQLVLYNKGNKTSYDLLKFAASKSIQFRLLNGNPAGAYSLLENKFTMDGVVDIMTTFGPRFKKSVSLLGAIPNLWEHLRIPGFIKLLTNDPLIKKSEDSKENWDRQLKHLVLFGQVRKDIQEKINELLPDLGALDSDDVNNAPIHLFRDARTGELDSNVVTALAWELMNWVATYGRDTEVMTKEEVAQKVLGLNDASDVSDEAHNDLSTKGLPLQEMVNIVGRHVYEQLNFRQNTAHPEDGFFEDRLISSFGLLAYKVAMDMGVLQPAEETRVDKKLWDTYKTPNKPLEETDYGSSGEYVQLVRLAYEDRQKEQGDGTTEEITVLSAPARQFSNGYYRNQKLFRNLFETRVDSRHSSSEPIPVSRAVPRTEVTVPSEMLDNAQKYANQGHSFNPYIVKLADKISIDTFKKILAPIYTSSVPVHKKNSYKGKLRHVTNSLVNYFRELSSSGGKTRYFPYRWLTNFRQMLDSLDLDAQNNKIHRFFMMAGKETTYTPIKRDEQTLEHDAYRGFIKAAGQSLGIKLNKTPILEVEVKVRQFLRRLRDDHENLINKLSSEDAGQLTVEEGIEFENLVKSMGEKEHSIIGLMAMIDYINFEDDINATEFKHSLPLDVDSTTSGLALTLMQFTPNDIDDLQQELFDGVGLFSNLAPQDKEKFVNAIKDAYERLADQLRTRKSGTLVEGLNLPNDFEGQQEVILEAAEDLVAFRWMDDLMGWKSVLDQNNTDDQDTTQLMKALRQFAKGPVMTLNYSMGRLSLQLHLGAAPLDAVDDFIIGEINKIQELHDVVLSSRPIPAGHTQSINIVENSIQQVKLKMVAMFEAGKPLRPDTEVYVNEEGDRFTLAQILYSKMNPNLSLENINRQTATKELDRMGIFNTPTEAYEWERDKDELLNRLDELAKGPVPAYVSFLKNYNDFLPNYLKENISKRIGTYSGKIAYSSVESDLMNQWNVRNNVNLGINIVSFLYAELYNNKVKEFIEENGTSPNKDQENRIVRDLLNAGHAPTFPFAGSDPGRQDYANQLYLVSNEPVDVSEEPKAQATLGFKEGENVSVNVDRFRPKNSVGVRGGVLLIQAVEATIANMVAAKLGIPLTMIYDGYLLDPAKAGAVSREFNEEFSKRNKEYSIVDSVLSRVRDFQPIYEELAKDKDFVKRFKEQFRYKDFNTLLRELNSTNEEVKLGRQNIESKIKIVNNYYDDTGEYFPPATQGEAPGLILSSEPEATVDIQGPAKKYENLGETEAAKQLFEDMAEQSEGQITDAHKEHLRKLWAGVIIPGLKKVEGLTAITGVSATGKSAGKVTGNTIYIAAAGNQRTSPNRMSPLEVATHEFVHAVLKQYLETDFEARKVVEDLMEQAREVITVDDFMPDDAHNLEEARIIAQERYDYAFNSPNAVHEFAALGLTNEPFAQALTRVDTESADTAPNTWFGSIVTKLGTILYKALSWVTNTGYDATKDKNVHAALVGLSEDLTNINRQNRLKFLNTVDTLVTQPVSQLNTRIKAFYTGQDLSQVDPQDKEFLASAGNIQLRQNISKLMSNMGDRWGEFAKNAGLSRSDLASDLFNEIKGLNPRDKSIWRRLRMAANARVDQPRLRMAETVNKLITKSFSSDTSKEEWKAVNDILLRLDLETLVSNGRSLGDLVDYLRDLDQLDAEIHKVQSQIEAQYPEHAKAWRLQAEGLGVMMATGKARYPMQQSNAHGIVRQMFVTPGMRKLVSNMDRAEQLVEVLAALEGIKASEGNVKRLASNVIVREANREGGNGVVTLLGLHKAQKAQELDLVWNGNKLAMAKGRTRENTDNRARVVLAPMDPAAQKRQEKLGYTFIREHKRDPRDRGVRMGLYYSTVSQDRMRAQAFSYTDPAKTDAHINEGITTLADRLELRKDFKVRKEIKNALFKEAYNLYYGNGEPRTLPEDVEVMVPVYVDETGEISHFAYILSNLDKARYLKRDDTAPVTLGKMFSHVIDVKGTREVNKQVIDGIFSDYEELKDSPKYTFKEVSEKSSDPKLRELWRLIPDEFKTYIKKKNNNKAAFYVRADKINYIFGSREASLTSALIKSANRNNITIPTATLRAINTADLVWKEVMMYRKLIVTTATPAVVYGNMMSNFFFLLADGIPLSYITENASTSIRGLRRYLQQRKQLEELSLQMQVDAMNGKNIKPLQGRMASLQKSLELNPVHFLVSQGAYQTIVEDVNPELFGGISETRPVAKFAERMMERSQGAEGRIRRTMLTGASELFMIQGSESFNAVMTANQYADFVARNIKYNYDMQVRKVDSQRALNDAMEAFIYYDEAFNPVLQTAEDYGILQFTKFWLRIQRAIVRQFGEKPANVILQQMMQYLLMYDIDDVQEYFANFTSLANRFNPVGFEDVSDTFGVPPLIQFFSYPFVGE